MWHRWVSLVVGLGRCRSGSVGGAVRLWLGCVQASSRRPDEPLPITSQLASRMRCPIGFVRVMGYKPSRPSIAVAQEEEALEPPSVARDVRPPEVQGEVAAEQKCAPTSFALLVLRNLDTLRVRGGDKPLSRPSGSPPGAAFATRRATSKRSQPSKQKPARTSSWLLDRTNTGVVIATVRMLNPPGIAKPAQLGSSTACDSSR
jgi:hypothetical protein